MKTRLLMILGVAGLALAGCSSVPRGFAAKMEAAGARYDSIVKGMTEAQVTERLGPPHRMEGAVSTWETAYNEGNFQLVSVGFDGDRKVESIERRQRKMSGGAFASTWVEKFSEQ